MSEDIDNLLSDSEDCRSSDDEYIMEDFDKIAEALEDLVNRPFDKTKKMEKIITLKTMKDKVYQNLSYYIVDDELKIAGGTHKLFVIKIKFRDGLKTRILKLARDDEEDRQDHFERERKDAIYVTEIAKHMNSSLDINYNLFVWPLETVLLEIDGEERWGILQAPFITPDDDNFYCFNKVEPNIGKPFDFDPRIQRYQHYMAAMGKGMCLVRDWQGFYVDSKTFKNVLRKNDLLDNQYAKKDYVYVLIDFVLVTSHSHFNTRNMLDYGMEAMLEWKKYHSCKECRCHKFKLLDEIYFGLNDNDQEFFEKAKPVVQKSHSNNNHHQQKKNSNKKHHHKH